MTSLIDRVRAVCLQLPEASEQVADGQPVFLVADQPFVRMEGDGSAVSVRTDEGGEDWTSLALAGDPDWPAIEDALAHSWELVAPRGLLEAGGR
jgi:hypothetical protein